MSHRILIIGLDGASPHLVDKWRGHLPNLSRIMDRGVSGILESVIPPRSIPAWYCFATGMNPAKLGVFGFSQRVSGTYDYTFANISFCQAPTFWEWLNQNGLRTLLLHIPGTFPPQPLNGVMVSGWPAPENRGNLEYTYPSSMSRAIDEHLGKPFEFLGNLPMSMDNDREMLPDRLRVLRMHADVANWMLSEQTWDVAVVVLSELDRASHQFWRHLDDQHPAHDPSLTSQFGNALLKMYQEADKQVGQLVELLDEDDTLFIISDHGFGPAYRTFYLNKWLLNQGLLVLKPSASPGEISFLTKLVGKLTQPFFLLNNVSPTFRKISAPLKRGIIANYLRNEYVLTTKKGLVRLNHIPVDWDQTQAYCPDEASLYINIKGRDPSGIVDPGSMSVELLEDIEIRLRNVNDPATGNRLDVKTYRKESIYTGEFIDQAPELIIEMDNYSTEVMAELGSASVFTDNNNRSGTHTLDGLIIAMGSNIRNIKNFQANLIDIAPTVIHMMGLSIFEESDGRVLLEIFRDGSTLHRQPKVTKGSKAEKKGRQIDLSPEEKDQIEKQLRNLGYMQ